MNKNDKFDKFMQNKLTSSGSSQGSGLKGVFIVILVVVGIFVIYRVTKPKSYISKNYSNSSYSKITTYQKTTKKVTTYKSNNAYKTKQTTARKSTYYSLLIQRGMDFNSLECTQVKK